MPGGRLARRYSRKLPLAAYSTSTYRGPAGKGASEEPLPAPLPHPWRSEAPTSLCAGAQQVDDVFVLSDHFHHLHL